MFWSHFILLLIHVEVVTDILHLHNKRVHTFRGNYTEYLEAASDLETGKFLNKNKHKMFITIFRKVP